MEIEPAQVLTMLKRVRGLSDAQVAERAGMSVSQVRERRYGATSISLEDAAKLCDALDVPFAVWGMSAAEAALVALEDPED